MKRQQANADGKGGDGEAEVDARYELARALVKKGAYAEATEHYVWLWENIPRKHPAMHGVRSSFMIGQMARLLSNFPAARVAFERLRVEALKSTSKSGDRDDWIVLNSLLGHDDETLDWFDKSKNDSKQKETIRKSDFDSKHEMGRFDIPVSQATREDQGTARIRSRDQYISEKKEINRRRNARL